VSFDKGCYVGQELTARTHFQGLIRKRVMPVQLPDGHALASETDIMNEDTGKSAGKLCASAGVHGLALLRLKHAADALHGRVSLLAGGALVRPVRPEWWPAKSQSLIAAGLV